MRRLFVRLATPVAAAAVTLGGLAMHTPAQAAELPPSDVALTIQSAANATLAELTGGSLTDGTTITENHYQDSSNQQWRLEWTGNHHKIKSNLNGAWCLARDGDGNNQNIALRGCDTVRADWDFESAGDEKWRIKDPAGSYFLTVANSTPSPGRQLVTSTVSNSDTASWFLNGLEVTRRPMPADPRLDQVTFLTTHNAFANTDEGFWGRFPNQSYSLRSQLDQGVRALQLDTYDSGGTVKLCHGSCWWNEKTLSSGLEQVVSFLQANRSAVVTLFLEDYTSHDTLKAAVTSVSGINDLLFYPSRYDVRSSGWPTVSRMVSDNKRLLIFSQRSGRDDFGVFYDRDWTVENYWSLGTLGSNVQCYSRWTEVPLNKREPGFVRLHVMNQYRDIGAESSAAADNSDKLWTRAKRICGPAARRKPNYVAVDFFQKPESNPPSKLVQDMNTYW